MSNSLLGAGDPKFAFKKLPVSEISKRSCSEV